MKACYMYLSISRSLSGLNLNLSCLFLTIFACLFPVHLKQVQVMFLVRKKNLNDNVQSVTDVGNVHFSANLKVGLKKIIN